MKDEEKSKDQLIRELNELRNKIGDLESIEEELKQTKGLLQDNKRLLEKIQRMAKIGNWELDISLNRLHWSEEIYRIFEIDQEKFEATYETFLSTIHPDDLEMANKAYMAAVENHTPYEITHRIVTPDGVIKHVHERSVEIKDNKGNTIRSIGTVQDITEQKEVEDALKYRLEFENIITTVSTHFINLPSSEIDNGINQAMETIGRFEGIDRSYVFLFSDDGEKITCTHEWCAEGVEPQLQQLQNIALEREFPWFAKKIKNFETVYIPRVAEMPDEAKAEREEFEREKIVSLIDVPMISGGFLLGFLGFEAVHGERTWTDDIIALLKIVGEIFVNALERKHKEEVLIASENRYRTLVENANDMIYMLDLKGNFTFLNTLVEKSLGINREELYGKSFGPLIHPDDLKMIMKEREKVLNGESRSFVFRVFDSNGEQRILSTNSVPLFEKGRVVGNIGFARDITEQMAARDALRKSEERNRTLIENMPTICFTFDKNGQILSWNKAAETVYGYTKDEAIGASVYDLIVTPETREATDQLIKKVFEGEVITGAEWQDRNRKGETGWRMGYAFPLYGKDGSIEFGVIMNVDITDRKLADTELRKSEEKYRQLFEFSPAQNLIIGADGIIKDVNKAVINGSGYKREELVGRNILDLVTIEQKENMGPKLEKYFKEGFEEETEVVACASDGSEHTVLFAAGEPVFIYEGDQITGTLLTGIDITERKQALEKIKQHEDQLLQAAKMVSLGTLVSGVAHEINNPNHFILLNSKIFSRVWEDIVPILSDHEETHEDFYLAGMPFNNAREKLPALLSGILEGALRIEKIVRSLKDFSRQDKGELDQRIAVNSVVEDAIVIISNLIKKSTNRFSVVYGSDLPAVQGNSQQLEQVVINLISNSCQALQSREKRLLVSTDYDRNTDCIIIKVEDKGEGIPPENMKSIMDPFFTTKRDRQGTGLGLSISYNIVANHKGELKISSQPGRGTTAVVRLPVFGKLIKK